jgi:hypothetical protein
MTFLSPFNVRSPVFFVELSQAGHEIKYFCFRRVPTGMIFLGCLDDKIDDAGKTTAAAASFFHGMINFSGNDELPTVFIEKGVDDFLDFGIGNVIATADQHSRSVRQT